MKKTLLITEQQMVSLANYIMAEGRSHDAVGLISDDLSRNYEPAVGTYKKGGEYFDKPMINKKVDGEMISPKDLLEYLKYKHKDLNEEFLEQIIRDWVDGNLDDNQLSKNVKM
jgi:hypothetical protein